VVWIAILVATVVAVAGWNQLHQRRPQHRVAAVASPSPSPTPTTPAPPSASRVWLTDSYNYTNDDDGSFVLDLDLHNFNTVAIQVEAGVVHDPVGIDKLAMSLLPVRFDGIRPGEGRPAKQIRMEARSFGTLRLTGRVNCKRFSTADSPLPIRVNGEPAALTFPPVDTDHHYWPQIIHANCPS
jgi:hypothetical protein